MSEVELIKLYRDNHKTRERMPRWLAELEVSTIPTEQPDVLSAKIVPFVPVINGTSVYRQSTRVNWQATLQLGQYLTAALVA